MSRNEEELSIMGYNKVYDYTQFSHDNDINVIPQQDFQKLVTDTFKNIANILKSTYGPYGSPYMLSENVGMYATKDGFNTFEAMDFSHQYKKMVYMQIKQIISRVNDTVGDGTTSCIMLANELFDILHDTMKGKDKEFKRLLLKELDNIEHFLNTTLLSTPSDKRVAMLTKNVLWNLINLADNYDEEITNVIYDALDPEIDDSGHITSIRNVSLKRQQINGISTIRDYKLAKLEGDYRVTIDMDQQIALYDFANKRDITILLYDHRFVEADWMSLKQVYDFDTETVIGDETKTPRPLLICAPSFATSFMNTLYDSYGTKCLMKAKPINIILCGIKGSFVQNEIKDLSELLQIPIHKLESTAVDFSKEKTVTCKVTNGDCLALFNVTSPDEYIKTLEYELENLKKDSKIIKDDYINRINALRLNAKDSIIEITAPNALESTMIFDKMLDCISIAKSAFENGVVPNMLVYGYQVMNDYYEKATNDIAKTLATCIKEAIKKIFEIIWKSKYDDNNDLEKTNAIKLLYSLNVDCENSFNIITNEFVSYTELPTSSQYDIEVLSASISIIKYMITSSGFIFDSQYMKAHGDTGRYIQQC